MFKYRKKSPFRIPDKLAAFSALMLLVSVALGGSMASQPLAEPLNDTAQDSQPADDTPEFTAQKPSTFRVSLFLFTR